ncbi:hypothetical protein T484DRAFT_2021934 [Baffinella frigidus]|nr:hypothetical protein T484DRAFT_2021934 [Cryptophyta sp. CCMP2293]
MGFLKSFRSGDDSSKEYRSLDTPPKLSLGKAADARENEMEKVQVQLAGMKDALEVTQKLLRRSMHVREKDRARMQAEHESVEEVCEPPLVPLPARALPRVRILRLVMRAYQYPGRAPVELCRLGASNPPGACYNRDWIGNRFGAKTGERRAEAGARRAEGPRDENGDGAHARGGDRAPAARVRRGSQHVLRGRARDAGKEIQFRVGGYAYGCKPDGYKSVTRRREGRGP